MLFCLQLAYGIIWLQGYSGGVALGFFMLGISPGGGPSNMYTHLLGGDMSISITMTLLSTVLSVGESAPFDPFISYLSKICLLDLFSSVKINGLKYFYIF